MRDKTELKNQIVPESAWCKSSYSGGGSGSDCVEVAKREGGRFVRDSKDPKGPTLFFTDSEWAAFTKGVQDGEAGLM
ncbi:DUF397 domain-containing protein [Streptomyces sp. NPDC059080]|uniref:DUF397 domain-containing protein n=1 Tax=Streptomyces sp. NPDC059080 TaxID=3346718 RepID=UPI00369073AF